MTAPTFKPDDIELIPDAWGRFERAVDTVSKSGPMHRTAPTLVERCESFLTDMREFTARLDARPSLQARTPD